MPEDHVMIMDYEQEGTEEWYCPQCGYRLRIEWNPWKREVLIPGNDSVVHRGGKGGLTIGRVSVEPKEE